MTTNLTTERTRRLIGRRVEHCPYCDKPLSFRDNRPFCRACRLLFVSETKDAMEDRR